MARENSDETALESREPSAASVVVRVADEIVVDLMQSASGLDYEAASADVVRRSIGGVDVPFASPRLLLQMKGDKDRADAAFLRSLLQRTDASR